MEFSVRGFLHFVFSCHIRLLKKYRNKIPEIYVLWNTLLTGFAIKAIKKRQNKKHFCCFFFLSPEFVKNLFFWDRAADLFAVGFAGTKDGNALFNLVVRAWN